MKSLRLFVVILGCTLLATPAFPVSKEIVQLQTQVQALQDQMTQMRQSFDERMGVMKNLVEQSTDNVNKVAGAVNELNQTIQKSHQDEGGACRPVVRSNTGPARQRGRAKGAHGESDAAA